MQIEIKECCGVHGEIVEKGDVIEVDDPTAKMLVAIGKARPFNAEEDAEQAPEEAPEEDAEQAPEEAPEEDAGAEPGAEPGGEIEVQDPAPTHRDPAHRRRR